MSLARYSLDLLQLTAALYLLLKLMVALADRRGW
jgi:hypothetical protein